jgi:hypothetical protein
MYPTDPDAPPPSPDTVWALAHQAFREHAGHLHAALDWQVQQHGPDRAGVLLRGLAMLGQQVSERSDTAAGSPDPDRDGTAKPVGQSCTTSVVAGRATIRRTSFASGAGRATAMIPFEQDPR